MTVTAEPGEGWGKRVSPVPRRAIVRLVIFGQTTLHAAEEDAEAAREMPTASVRSDHDDETEAASVPNGRVNVVLNLRDGDRRVDPTGEDSHKVNDDRIDNDIPVEGVNVDRVGAVTEGGLVRDGVTTDPTASVEEPDYANPKPDSLSGAITVSFRVVTRMLTFLL